MITILGTKVSKEYILDEYNRIFNIVKNSYTESIKLYEKKFYVLQKYFFKWKIKKVINIP